MSVRCQIAWIVLSLSGYSNTREPWKFAGFKQEKTSYEWNKPKSKLTPGTSAGNILMRLYKT